MAVQIRDATPADEASCAALLAELAGTASHVTDPGFSEVFEMLLSQKRGQIVLAVEDGTALGMVTVSFNLALRYRGEYCQLEELIVSPRARGRNLGGRLVQATVDIATRRGCGEIGLYLVERTEHNRAFYAKYGFEAVGTEMRQRLNA
ncbi:MAG: GNAT family N-acetyltransferase [Gammaproteobacteria bacterium]|nr:GNAT family N-acetyltransferase [Gammaproteobacteria bacterium]